MLDWVLYRFVGIEQNKFATICGKTFGASRSDALRSAGYDGCIFALSCYVFLNEFKFYFVHGCAAISILQKRSNLLANKPRSR
ncbi:hypothetical protein OAV68_00125 [bacterium]|nr:hypothetical protein [bacterium]